MRPGGSPTGKLGIGAQIARLHRTKLTRILAPAVFALPALAHAHPGHGSRELTWNFDHPAAHPLATIPCLGVMFLAGWTVPRLRRQARTEKIPTGSRH